MFLRAIYRASYHAGRVRARHRLLPLFISIIMRNRATGLGVPSWCGLVLFAHRFDARHIGRGFGLHSSTLAVRELGGSIQTTSGGLGKGAPFRSCCLTTQ